MSESRQLPSYPPRRPIPTAALLQFALTIFAGATLLFACQPIIGRMVVPLLGGAPAVWIVCSLFFETILLFGYAYAHYVGTKLPIRAQVVLQLAIVASVFLVMPVSVDERVMQRLTAEHPTLGLCLVLLRSVGLPFFVLSTSSPLLQRWFAELGEKDPYHLYAASNAGSFVALLGYPLALEPLLPVHAQGRALHTGYAVYAVCVVACAFRAMRARSDVRVDTTPAPPQVLVTSGAGPRHTTPAQRWRERLVWIALSFGPSSLLLGATEYVTTDVASVPLLWVLPLALYLLSFIVAFAKRQPIKPATYSRGTALVAAIVAAITLADVTGPAYLVIAAHMLLLFLASVVCHRGIAERRPHVTRLTEFYLLMSIGGVLGGAFNGLLAPWLFDDLYEYPIAIALVCLGRASLERAGSLDWRRIGKDVALGAAVGLATYGLVKLGAARRIDRTGSFGWMFGVPLVFAFMWSARPLRYAVAIGGLLLAGMSRGYDFGTTIWADRGFFGVLKVMVDSERRSHLLVSGNTMHGKQALDPEGALIPLAYYHPTGPAGDVLGPLPSWDQELVPRKVAVIGLGVGSLAAYARPGDEWTFFEINPSVVEVATEHFTYLRRAEESAVVHVEVGDARLRLREATTAPFDVLVLDAFSSDSVPTHLVTREAFAIYKRALRPGGVLLAHVSNDHVQLQPVLGALAKDAGMYAIDRRDDDLTREEKAAGKSRSEWVLMSERKDALDLTLRGRKDWHPLAAPAGQSVWTDDYANVLGSLRF
ncbi:MAG: fused MFS/spermidine synthase [Labilithrix sp.]|nr:fused MFS/spermidine synthase [Labilithrix sp.]MCW5815646.1 fused MFS/spermidine synthase [Labilithrix sp.]